MDALLNMLHKDVFIFSCLARLTYVLRNEMEETKTKVVIISLNGTQGDGWLVSPFFKELISQLSSIPKFNDLL